jgi:hypothetical protein
VETCGRPFIVGLFSHLAIYNSEIIASPSFNLSSRELLIFKGMTRVLDLIRLEGFANMHNLINVFHEI